MKLYRTRTQAEYDFLARVLEKKGMVSFIPLHEQGGDMVVYADEEEDCLSYSDLDYAEEEYPDKPIIEVSDLMKPDTLEQVVAEKNNVELTVHDDLMEDFVINDPIEPSHYRKGEIDLYEAAYQTRPFNEFRAIMEFVAERYIKRDKDNRVEDINKAIYTLERLKEYEEMEK